jgi:hypothetical protein
MDRRTGEAPGALRAIAVPSGFTLLVSRTHTACCETPPENDHFESLQDEANAFGAVDVSPEVQSTSAPGPALNLTVVEDDVVEADVVSEM